MDIFAEVSGDTTDHNFIAKNYGPGKLFPGGPTYNFNGKDVPYFVRWSKTGSTTGPILLEMLKEMDHRDWLDRKKHPGVAPLYICDAHGSRFHLGLLVYQNQPEHRLNSNQGCPNMTADWQVGDSQQQNGTENLHFHQLRPILLLKKAILVEGSYNFSKDIQTRYL